jgi:hypothetical protein
MDSRMLTMPCILNEFSDPASVTTEKPPLLDEGISFPGRYFGNQIVQTQFPNSIWEEMKTKLGLKHHDLKV